VAIRALRAADGLAADGDGFAGNGGQTSSEDR
jgi:hypothetical protein